MLFKMGVFKIFCKIHRNAPGLESLFKKVIGHLYRKPPGDCFGNSKNIFLDEYFGAIFRNVQVKVLTKFFGQYNSVKIRNNKQRWSKTLSTGLQGSNCRSSRSQMFCKIGVFKNFANLTGKHLSWGPANLLKRDSKTGVFMWNFKEHFFYRTHPVAAFLNG